MLILGEGRSCRYFLRQTRILEASNCVFLKEFVYSVVEFFWRLVVEAAHKKYITVIDTVYIYLIFSSCIGSSDCAGWKWDNSPVCWQSNFKGMDGSPTCRKDILRWKYTYLVHHVRHTWCAKQKTITDHTVLFNYIRNGKWPGVVLNKTVSGYDLKSHYFLVDVI